MRLLCELGRHRAGPRPRWNEGYYFSQCRDCGRDLVRTPFERWQVPRGYRVVWSPQPPENRHTARLAPAPPWVPADERTVGGPAPKPEAGPLNLEPAPEPSPESAPESGAEPSPQSGPEPVPGPVLEPAFGAKPALAAPLDVAAMEDPADDPPVPAGLEAPSPAVRSVFAWAEPAPDPAAADRPAVAEGSGDLSIGEVLRILREEDARAGPEPEGGTIAPVSEPLELDLSQLETDEAVAPPAPPAQALTVRRQRSRRGLRVAIAAALAIASAALVAYQVRAAAPAAEAVPEAGPIGP